MGDTFSRKLIECTIQLGKNTQTNQPNQFTQSGGDTVTISGARTSVRIANSGAPSSPVADIDIYGLSDSLMNQLSTLGMQVNFIGKNIITIQAGDDQDGLSTVFSGTILSAYADFNAAPFVPFRINARAALLEALAPATPLSYSGTTDVATIASAIARQMGVGFENNGINQKLSNPYLPGSTGTQLDYLRQHANIRAEIVDGGRVLAIWPKYGSRNTNNVPIIARPPTGLMIGYPSYTQQGIMVKTIFNPQITFGSLIEIRTETAALEKANGQYTVGKMDLALDSLLPGGLWEATIYAYSPNNPNPILAPK